MTIDERLEVLLHSGESLNATCKKLTAESNKHDRRWERMRRAALAAEGEPVLIHRTVETAQAPDRGSRGSP